MSTLRNRNPTVNKASADTEKSTTNEDSAKVDDKNEIKNGELNTETKDMNGKLDNNDSVDKEQLIGSYWLNRIVFIRYLSFIYIVAFLVALHQNKQLIGKHGLLPSDTYLNMIKSHFGESQQFKAFMNIPTLLLFIDNIHIDWWLDFLAIAGLFLSVLIFTKGASNMVIMFQLWILYHSITNVGQRWYSFGWESQLLESGFIAIFFVPVLEVKQLPAKRKPSWVVLWANRWMIFRIMLGAGLIKIRGDKCWRDLTCMEYHYQTQPVPNPVSYYLHQSPPFFHKFETLSNHFVELIAPILLMMPRKLRIIGGSIQILFQVVLIISGNLSFLNWLTILPSIACFDDYSLSFMFSSSMLKKVIKVQAESKARSKTVLSYIYKSLDYVILGLIGLLSIPVVQNLLSSQQAMNTSFDSFRIVNTYGAFGSVTKTRTEVIIQGTRNSTIIPDDAGGLWEEYEFHCKPGDIKRRPCVISPYHYRLDWLMWFSAFQNYQQNPWLIHLAAKLLVNDNNATSLISYNPFADGKPPRFIRGQHYKYEYTKIGTGSKNWWKRKLIGSYFPAVDLETLRPFLSHHRWKVEKKKVSRKS